MQADLDKFRFIVVRALRYYETMLIGLANNIEGIRFEPIINPFGHFLDDTAKQAATAAREIRQDATEITTLVVQDRYRTIVREALAFYISELSEKREIIHEELREEGNRIFSQFDNEIGTAKIMKQHIDELVEGVKPVEEDEPVFSGVDNNNANNNHKK